MELSRSLIGSIFVPVFKCQKSMLITYLCGSYGECQNQFDYTFSKLKNKAKKCVESKGLSDRICSNILRVRSVKIVAIRCILAGGGSVLQANEVANLFIFIFHVVA